MTLTATKTWASSKSTGMKSLLPGMSYGAYDEHLTAGTWTLPQGSSVRFSTDFSGMYKLISAHVYVRTTNGIHGNLQNAVLSPEEASIWPVHNVRAGVCGGSGWVSSTYMSLVNRGDATYTVSDVANTWHAIPVTNIVNRWLPSYVLQSNGSAGLGQTAYGIGFPGSSGFTEFWSYEAGRYTASKSGFKPYMYLVYETTANRAPNNGWVYEVGGAGNGATITDTTPTIKGANSADADGDTLDQAQVQYQATTAYGVENFSAPTQVYSTTPSWNGSNWLTEYTTPALSNGQWYNARVVFRDWHGSWGAWAGTSYFYVNALPNAPTVEAGVCRVSNLGDDSIAPGYAAWDATNQYAKPYIRLTVSDPDGDNLTRYKITVRSSAGGSVVHTQEAAVTWASGSTHDVALTYGFVNGTNYYVTAEVQDVNAVWGTASSEATVRVRWGQAIYEHNVGTSGQYEWNGGSLEGTAEAVYRFRSATGSGGAGAGSFKTSIGEIGLPTWVNVLVRFASGNDTSPVAGLADMSMDYKGSAQAPDQWVFNTGFDQGGWLLSSDTRRYGTKALRFQRTTADPGATTWSYAQTSNYGTATVPVIPGQTYTASGWVKCTALDGWTDIRVMSAGNAYLGGTNNTSDTSDEPDGWKRLSATMVIPDGVYFVRIAILYTTDGSTTAGDTVYYDAVQLEEGPVASAWNPGQTGAVVMDVGGIEVDAGAGASFRLRGSDGTVNDVIDLHENGLRWASEVSIYSDGTDLYAKQATGGKVVPITKEAYPVGSIFISTSHTTTTAVATALGYGTWAKYAQGKVLFGDSDSDGDFDAGDTGGAKTHNHTYSTVISHNHGGSGHGHSASQDNHTHVQYGANTAASQYRVQKNLRVGNDATSSTSGTASASGTYVGTGYASIAYAGSASGTTSSPTALPPYIAVYMYERTA